MRKNTIWAVAALLPLTPLAHASEQEGWQFELAPYFWGANVDGDVTAGSQKVSIDRDTWENLESGFMGFGTVSYDRFVFYLDYDYLSTSDDGKTKNGLLVPVGTKVDADFDTNIVTGGIGYRFDTWGEHSWIDVMAGVRNLTLDRDIKVGSTKFSHSQDVTDPMLLLRPSIHISDNWRFNGLLGLGVGGDSDTTYELMPQFQYNFTDLFSVRFGYKKIYYDVNSGHKDTAGYKAFDGSFSGPFIGVGFNFPQPAKPAPVAAVPPPPPPPPAKCADSDNDGVCDTADQCPNTPPGKRVGPAGCDCDYTLKTHFAFNSAVVSDEDKDQLDKLAKVLVNPKLSFISGRVEGHTDAIGKPDYNQKLSERRAKAVADYLESKGVATGSHLTVEGHGENDPIADNKTAEGRAENRRVVISRTDCSAR
ncbi:MAG TPA: OmpA family protein [Spongiibacteraceae bacterium]|nr:OmpA family protein [Spongiibacteraceae bacterium]